MTIAVYDHAPKPPASLDHATTITAVVELSKRTWLVVPGLERRPLKRTEDRAPGLLRILTTWRKRAEQAGRTIARIVVAFEAGRDGFWSARLLRRTGIEAYVIHPSSIPVPRGGRVKTDRIDLACCYLPFQPGYGVSQTARAVRTGARSRVRTLGGSGSPSAVRNWASLREVAGVLGLISLKPCAPSAATCSGA
jgi:hypothetical protein